MTHKTHTLSLTCIRASTAAFLLVGAANVFGFHGQQYLSFLSGGGVTLEDVSAANPATAHLMPIMHAAAPVETSTTELQLMLGVLFILAGFGFHALYILRKEQIFKKDHPIRASLKGVSQKFWSHLDKAMN